MIENGFKTKAFGGFDKKQVLKYIDDIHAQFEQKSTELDAQINELDAECKQLAESLENTYNKNVSLETEIKELTDQKNELVTKLEQTSTELESVKKRESEQKELLKRATFQVESMKRKCDKYDELHGQINDILAEAKQMKENILSQAHTQADDIISEAKSEAERITSAAKIKAESYVGGISQAAGDITTIRSGVAALAKQVDDKLAEIQDLINAADTKSANSYKSSFNTKPKRAPEKQKSDDVKSGGLLENFF